MVSPNIMSDPGHRAVGSLSSNWLGHCLSCSEKATHVGVMNGIISDCFCKCCVTLWKFNPVKWYVKLMQHLKETK